MKKNTITERLDKQGALIVELQKSVKLLSQVILKLTTKI